MNKEVGTAYYIAPEVINLHYTEKCDMWSIVVILYIMICGRPPFDGRNENEILQNVKGGSYDLSSKDWMATSPEVRDFVSKLMEYDYNKRMSAKEALDHVWIQKKVKTTFNVRQAETAMSNLKLFTATEKLK